MNYYDGAELSSLEATGARWGRFKPRGINTIQVSSRFTVKPSFAEHDEGFLIRQ